MAKRICRGCGGPLPDAGKVCPECNTRVVDEESRSAIQAWEQEYQRIRRHWVIAVTMFWVTAGITAGLFLIHGQAYVNELVFIAAILMALGVYLKTRVLRLQRNKPQS